MSKRPSLAESMKGLSKPASPLPALPSETPPPSAAVERGSERKFHAATREGLKKLTTGVEPAKHKQLKRLSVDQDKPVEALLREAIDDLLVKYGVQRTT